MGKIMVVDDNKDIVETIKMIVISEGHEVQTAYSGEELVENVDGVNPDLIFLDVMMPGFTLKETLSELEKKKKPFKIVLVTVVRFMEEEKEEIFKCPLIKGYITKPFDIGEIKQKIKELA